MNGSSDNSFEHLKAPKAQDVLAFDSPVFLFLHYLQDSNQIAKAKVPADLPGTENTNQDIKVIVLPYYNQRNDPYGLGTWAVHADSGAVTNARISTVPQNDGIHYEVTISTEESFRRANALEADQLLEQLEYISQLYQQQQSDPLI